MKKTILLLVALTILFSARVGVSATYYVRTDGSNTSPYDTEAKGATACKTVVDYLNANGAAGGDTIDIGPGTFGTATDYLALYDADIDNVTVQGAGRTATIISTDAAAGEHTLYVGDALSSVTVKHLTLIANNASKKAFYKTSDAGTVTLENVDFISGSGHADHLINVLGDTTNLINCRAKFRYSSGKYPFYASGDSAGNIIGCQFYATGNSPYSEGVICYGTGTTNIYNSVILDAATTGIVANNGTLNIKNCVAQGGVFSHTNYAIFKAGGTVNATNNLLISSPFVNEYWCNALDTDTSNIKTNADPGFIAPARGGFLIPQIDDSGGYTSGYVEAVETLLAAHGWCGTWYTNISNMGSEYYAGMRTLLGRGTIEIGSHGYTHSNLTTTGNLFSITKAGHTVNIDRGNDQIVIDGASPVTVTGFKAKTLTAIRSELTTGGCTLGDTVTAIDNSTHGEIIADSSGAQASGYVTQLLIDATGETGLFRTEIIDAKTILADTIINGAGNVTDPQTGSTYVCNSMGATYNAGNASTKAAVIAGGFTNYRYNGGASAEASVQRTTDIDLYSIGPLSYQNIVGDGSEADIRQNTRALAFSIIQNGLVVPFFAHNTGEFSINQWTWFLDELSKYPITVTSAQKAATMVRANWTDDEDGTYSKTYTTYTDPRLQATSPCINTGTNPFSDGDGDQYDYDGNLVWSDTTDAAVGMWSDGAEIGLEGWSGGILLQ